MLEDLASTFHLRIQTVINRLEDLLANGTLTGINLPNRHSVVVIEYFF